MIDPTNQTDLQPSFSLLISRQNHQIRLENVVVAKHNRKKRLNAGARCGFQFRGRVRKILRNLLSPDILELAFAFLNNESYYPVDIGLLGTNRAVLLADIIRYLIEQFHESNTLASM